MLSNSSLAPTLSGETNILLIPETGIQFIDLPLVLPEKKQRFRFSYHPRANGQPDQEEKPEAASAISILHLRPGTEDEYDNLSNQNVDENQIFTLDEKMILEGTHSTWFPLPFLRVAQGHDQLDNGPYNWVRGFVTKLEGAGPGDPAYRLTIAVDTTTQESGSHYNAPTRENVYDHSDVFRYAVGNSSLLGFLQKDWVQIWSKNTFFTPDRLRKPEILTERDDELENKRFEENYHYALYCGLIHLLGDVLKLPELRLLDTSAEMGNIVPIDVDLVLDVGNSRTCGILFEHSENAVSLNNCYSLKLRDLNAPAYIHDGPFSSRMEFVDHAFGDEFASRQALGNEAFVWPSIVRLGPEADRLAGLVFGNEGDMGLNSPKRYIWDVEKNENTWFMNPFGLPKMANRVKEEKHASKGDFMGSFSDTGEPLSAENPFNLTPNYSRSSMMTFFLAELFLQAFNLINAPHIRYNRQYFNRPRQIRRIVLTVPTAMTLEERLIFEKRVHTAKEQLWRVLGLDNSDSVKVIVKTQWDEAVATQAVFLYNETITNFKGRLSDYFGHFGLVRTTPEAVVEDEERESPLLPREQECESVRIASIDIGGGTTDLIVTTYYLQAGDQIIPYQNFREGFNVAGDDIVGDIIEKLILPHIAIALTGSGHANPLALIDQLAGPDREGMQVGEKSMRRQFTSLVLQPLAIELINIYESAGLEKLQEVATATIDEFLDLSPEIKERFDRHVAAKNEKIGVNFDRSLFDISLNITIRDIDTSIRSTMDTVIHNLAEVVYAHDCDFLLLTGRPSQMPAIRDLMLRILPIDANRLYNMHDYRVGSWYPYHSLDRRLSDPKTTVSVGAMVCALSQGHLDDFSMFSDHLSMRSTARYIGFMDRSFVVKDTLFAEIDLDDEDLGGSETETVIQFFAPKMLGFRQMKQTRWQSTPYYFLTYDKEVANRREERLAPPHRVTLGLRRPDKNRPYALEILSAENSRGVSVADAIKIRLQTLPNFGRNADQHWLDVGAFDIVEVEDSYKYFIEKNSLTKRSGGSV